MKPDALESDATDLESRYDRARLWALAIVVLVAVATALPLFFNVGVGELLSFYLALHQDLPLAPIILLAVLFRPTRKAAAEADPKILVPAVIAAILLILVAGWLGHRLAFLGADLSRDEQMAVFDQEIFSRGRLMWPIAPDWRYLADALNRRFMIPIGDREFWVSGYLPVHAAFRALVGKVADPALASPAMTALGALSIWGIGRRLWPDSPRATLVTLLLFVTSSQVLIMSMTAFSMSMHLGLNLLWLWLFLQNKRGSHGMAVAVGFLATGIHQPLFHPLFVAPFLLLLAQERRWRVLAFYVGCYAIIGLFWLWWPVWIAAHGASPPTPISCGTGNCSSGTSFVDRLMATVTTVNPQNMWLTAANLLRFICWQHPLLLPLALFGAISCWRSEPLARALTVGFLLPLVALAILLPWQGHGWGYRYLHPVIGNAVLLAGFGFNRIERGNFSLNRALAITSAAAIALVPIHAAMAARVAAPFADVRKQLESIDADAVIVDTDLLPFGQDVVVNRFDLSNRPKLLIASLVSPADLPRLCARSTIAFVDAPRLGPLARLFNVQTPSRPSRAFLRLRAAASDAGCRVVEPDGRTTRRSW